VTWKASEGQATGAGGCHGFAMAVKAMPNSCSGKKSSTAIRIDFFSEDACA